MAYFLTWPTYGTWLHGDERGSVDRHHNDYGQPRLPGNDRRQKWEASRSKCPPVVLDEQARAIVAQAITDHCSYRAWPLHALAVRSNHVHVVVGNTGLNPERIEAELKAWATRRLREGGHTGKNDRVWVHHASTEYLWDIDSVSQAVDYVNDAQDIAK